MGNASLFPNNEALFWKMTATFWKNTATFMNLRATFLNNATTFRNIAPTFRKNTAMFRKDLTTPAKVDSYPPIPKPTNTRTPKTDSTMLPRVLIRQRVYPTKYKLSKQNAVNVKNNFYLWSEN